MRARAILERLIEFDTVSHKSNLGLMAYVADLLRGAGIDSTLIPDATGEKANLFAVVGPADVPGVVLSGHVDVVPVEGQTWTRPPFELTQEGTRLYGRGTTDMKGFDACAIALMLQAAERRLKVPLILALSHDEEVGCRGVGSMIDAMAAWPVQPRLCIVGEPTGLLAAIGHKGKVALRPVQVTRSATLPRAQRPFLDCAAGVERHSPGDGFRPGGTPPSGANRRRGAVRHRIRCALHHAAPWQDQWRCAGEHCREPQHD